MRIKLFAILTFGILHCAMAQNTNFSGIVNQEEICENTTTINLYAVADSSGVFSGAGITNHGNGTATFSPSSVGVGTNDISYHVKNDFISIAVGVYITSAIRSDGTLWAWGRNIFGQLGDSTVSIINVPTQIGTDKDWKTVFAGGYHTAALKNDGTLWAWGRNEEGQLGDGTIINKKVPTKIGNDTDWVDIQPATFHTIALKSNGTLWSWGRNTEGALGLDTITFANVPKQIGTASNWESIGTGFNHSVALKTNGTLWTWGENNEGELGNGTNQNKSIPTLAGTDTNWKTIIAGENNTFLFKNDNTLWGFGQNYNGELGIGTNVSSNIPIQIVGNWLSVKAGIRFVIALKEDSSLWAWGKNTNGGLGNPSLIESNIPVQIGTDTTWGNIFTRFFHSLAYKNDSTLWGWGMNIYGQLGDSTYFNKDIPTNINLTASTTKNVSILAVATSTDTQAACNSYTWVDGVTYFEDNSSAVHTIPNGASNMCDSTITLNLTITNVDTTTTVSNNVITANQAGASYQWLDCNNGNSVINGATNQSYTAPTNGKYAVEISYGGCTVVSSCVNITGVGIKEMQKNSLEIYPNPTNGAVFIDTQDEVLEIAIFDVHGKRIKKINRVSQIDLSKTTNGVYFMKITTKNAVKTIKLLKK